MTRYVLKFGGGPMKCPESIRRVAETVINFYEQKKPEQLAVALSAPGKINNGPLGIKMTDLLEGIYQGESPEKKGGEVLRRVGNICDSLGLDPPVKLIDQFREVGSRGGKGDEDYSYVVSFGERFSGYILGGLIAREKREIPSTFVDFDRLGLVTSEYKNAFALPRSAVDIERELSGLEGIVLVPGFIGCHKDTKRVTTLGRDGTNYTAALVAEAIDADAVYIFSDEPGVRRTNPLFVPDAEILKEISYEEAREFAELSAKIINAKAITPVENQNIPVYIVDENLNGTRISSYIDKEYSGAKIIASSSGHSIMTFKYERDEPGVLADIVAKFPSAGINIESISDEMHSISVAFRDPEGGLGKIVAGLNKKHRFSLENRFARISIIGEGMRNQIGLFERVAHAIARKGISIEMATQTLNQLNITMYIDQNYERLAVRALYDDLFREKV